jgi:hypothetical protein
VADAALITSPIASTTPERVSGFGSDAWSLSVLSSVGSTRSPTLRTSAASERDAISRRSSSPTDRLSTTSSSSTTITSLSVRGVLNTMLFHATPAASATASTMSLCAMNSVASTRLRRVSSSALLQTRLGAHGALGVRQLRQRLLRLLALVGRLLGVLGVLVVVVVVAAVRRRHRRRRSCCQSR